MYSKLITSAHNPTSRGGYFLPFCTPSGTGGQYLYNDGIRYYTKEGTASADGEAMLFIGNGTSTGAAGNKTGIIRLYGNSTYYTTIVANGALTGNRTLTLPNATGYIPVISISGTTLTIKTTS